MNLADITFPLGSVNMPGVSDEAFFIPKKGIIAWPAMNHSFENAADVAHYVQYGTPESQSSTAVSFTLVEGAKWLRLYNTQGKGKASWEYQGETDCKSVVNKVTLTYPKITDEARAFAKYAANGDFVFVIKHDSKYYVIGCPDYRATLTPNGDTGDAASSAKGITIDIECTDYTPLPTYIGKLVLSDGELDCATGIFTKDDDDD